MIGGMKVKTSVTLDEKLLQRIDRVLLDRESRSAFLVDAARRLARERERAERDARDAAILNGNASILNEEAADNLSFVADVFEEHDTDPP